MKAKDLIALYLKFFESKGHKVIPSSPLIPDNDPTVLFTTAGMHPLVPFLTGTPHPLGKRVADVQKCIRTVDIDEAGDAYHHTFFEMLGNWSFGDYFKKEAIEFSFEFLTSKDWLGLNLNRLAVSCFAGDSDCPRDNEAAEIWKELGVPEERIAFLDKEHNWWGPAGATGPCGPDTEMFYWAPSTEPPKEFDPNDDNWVEIWNDVFMQYNKTEEGKYEEMDVKNVDTGMGVERVAAVLQGFDDNYLTERWQPIISLIEELTGKKYEDNKKDFRIIADHMRAAVFILGDERGVTPSNVDQGYILRRFIRRAIRKLAQFNVSNATVKLSTIIIDNYQTEYPDLGTKKDFILKEVQLEEDKFQAALEKGLKEFEKMSSNKKVDGKEAFLLFQSYGFPIEMTEELAEEKGISVDVAGFNIELEKHKELSRKGAEQKFKGGLSEASDITKKYHTATHILNAALKKVLGDEEIKQKGSNITAERMRFDFNFPRKLTPEEKQAVEDEVNRVIELDLPVGRSEMDLEEAMDSGAQSEFGAKYPPKVSVYDVGEYSKEICMGPHVESTKEIGHFKIKKEESSAAGIRRIKAVLE